MSNKAWVTLATNDSYGLGALVLAHSIRRVGSIYPAVVMITPTVTDAMKERLRGVFAEVIVVDVLDSRDAAHLALLQRPELGITFTKLHCWTLTQYEKCVFLDADTLIVLNCDELFEREELSAAPDVGWPDCFNSGVFVFKPSKETFDALVKFAQERGSFDGGDQGLLNSFFSSWAHGDITKHLPFLYNVTSAAFYSYLPALKHFGQNLKIIHFIGAAKPWLQAFNWETRRVEGSGHLQNTLQLWWDLFVSSVHPQLDTTMVEIDPPPELPPLDLMHHYEPPLDPNSQFPWHHPETQKPQEEEKTQIDFTQFYDPWENYRGNIPPSSNKNHVEQNFTVNLCLKFEIFHDVKDVWNQTLNENIISFSNKETHTFEPQKNTEVSFNDTPSYNHKSSNNYYNNEAQNTYTVEEQVDIQNWETFNDHKQPQADTINLNIVPDAPKINNIENTHSISNGFTNGHNEIVNDYKEDVIPRHPYDGYYLKHIPIIDSRGRKVCSHELPKTPPPSPPLDLVLDVQNGSKCHSGVAGNLARVTPGPSSIQHDALNELTRRQGWEAGNIDYMGADSFDNIWAKISQTLAQPRTSPPKQITPAQSDAKVETLSAETVDVTQNQQTTEVIATPTVQATVPSAETTIASVLSSVEVDAPVIPVEVAPTSAVSVVEADVPSTKPEEVPPTKPEEVAPTKTEEVTPTKAEEVPPTTVEVAPTKAEEVPPTKPEEVTPTKTEEVPPTKVEEVPPTIVEVAPTKAKEVPPTTVEVPPTTVEVAPTKAEEVPPTKPEEVTPTKTEEVPPTKVEEVPPTIVEVAPTKPEVVTPTKAEEVPPTKAEEVHTTKSEVTPVTSEVVPTAAEIPPAAEVPSTVAEVVPPASIPKALDETKPVESLESKTTELKQTKEEIKSETTATATPTESTPKPEQAAVPEIEAEKPITPKVCSPAKSLDLSTASSDSPPLAQTPASEVPQPPVNPKSVGDGKGRKPAEKLQLCPPTQADPLPTPDSELEDAATLAQSIIASELATPTVTSPTPPAPLTPASPPTDKRLAADASVLDTPPAGPVSLAQIGVKIKPTTAEQIASSVEVKAEQSTPPTTPTEAPKEAPKKKIVKKVVKKDVAASSGEGPVPPPRKKEKKPKEK